MEEIDKKNRELNLMYIKGFLDSLAYINTFTNDGKSYSVEFIEKFGNDYQSTFRNHYNKKYWEVETEKISGDWRLNLQNEIKPYFDQVMVETIRYFSKDEKETLDYQVFENLIESKTQMMRKEMNFHIYHLLLYKFCDCLEQFVSKDAELIRVIINWHPKDKPYEGWYEGSSSDFLFDLGNEILFLHFGGSD